MSKKKSIYGDGSDGTVTTSACNLLGQTITAETVILDEKPRFAVYATKMLIVKPRTEPAKTARERIG